MPRLQDLALEALPAADQVADAHVGFGGDPDGCEYPAAIEPRQAGGVALVVLPLDARPRGAQEGAMT